MATLCRDERSTLVSFSEYQTSQVCRICVWLMMGFFEEVPWDTEERAIVDGYSQILKVNPALHHYRRLGFETETH
jgi:hypothetical protein